MISLTKKEISNSLEKVSREIENMYHYSNTPTINFLNNLTVVDLRIYMFISKLRYLSYYEDVFLDSINNEDINLDSLRERIFIDNNTKNKFSNKQIIKYIRNAFSHSDLQKELYRISINGRYLEIHLKEVKPCEFHIKMSLLDLDELINNIKNTNFYLSIFEDNKLKRFYLKDKLTKEESLNISNYLEKNKFSCESNYSKLVLEYYKDIKKSYETKEYDIMFEQRDILNKYNDLILKNINNLKSNKEELLKFLETLKSYEISKIIPLQAEKLSMKEDVILFIKLIYNYSNYSFAELENEFPNTGFNLSFDKSLNEIQEIIYNQIGNNPSRLFLFQGSSLVIDTYMEYISYYIMNVCDDEVIEIRNKEYKKENIRNSLAHGRWFIDNENNIVLCDTKNGKYNDYNFHWIEKIKLIDLLSTIYQKQNSKIKKYKKIND